LLLKLCGVVILWLASSSFRRKHFTTLNDFFASNLSLLDTTKSCGIARIALPAANSLAFDKLSLTGKTSPFFGKPCGSPFTLWRNFYSYHVELRRNAKLYRCHDLAPKVLRPFENCP